METRKNPADPNRYMKLRRLTLDARKRRLLAGAHDDERPALTATECVEVTSPAGELTETERREVEALAAAFGAEVES